MVEKHSGVWWFRLQQNVISQHYRILDSNNFRLISTFDEQIAKQAWENYRYNF